MFNQSAQKILVGFKSAQKILVGFKFCDRNLLLPCKREEIPKKRKKYKQKWKRKETKG